MRRIQPPLQFLALSQQDIAGRPLGDDASRIQTNDMGRKFAGFGDVVRSEENRDVSVLLPLLQIFENGFAQRKVEAVKGFVKKQQDWITDQSAGQRHTLEFAAGELRRRARGEMAATKHFHGSFRLFTALLSRQIGDAEGDIFCSRQVREQGRSLGEPPDVALMWRDSDAAGSVCPTIAADEDRADVNRQEAGDTAEQSALAGAGVTEEHGPIGSEVKSDIEQERGASETMGHRNASASVARRVWTGVRQGDSYGDGRHRKAREDRPTKGR